MTKKEDVKQSYQSQEYDKIFKENIEELIIPFAEKLLNINPKNLREIPNDLQTTLERKPDFLKKVIADKSQKNEKDKQKDFILHIEFQTVDEKQMAHRMNEYYAILYRKHQLDVHQYVFFIGEGKAKMEKTIEAKNLSFRFEVINMQDFSYELFLNSNKPEEVILAILADFGKQSSETVIKNILQKIKELPIENSIQKKTVIQLEVLSKLRKLQSQIIEQLNAMALTYNIEEDLRYKQGQESGKEIGKEETAKETILAMLKGGFTINEIVKYVKVSREFIEQIAKQFKN
jgi:predicted transposase/invertase (TIGR01784 family)